LIQFLRLTPRLESLELLRLSGANAVLEALATPPSPPLMQNSLADGSDASNPQATQICPSLVHVNLSDCPDVRTGPLVRLVKSRLHIATAEACLGEGSGAEAPLSQPVAEIASLKVDGCQHIEADVLPWLRGKVKVFSCVYMTKMEAKRRPKVWLIFYLMICANV
jgi:hypothetical protein